MSEAVKPLADVYAAAFALGHDLIQLLERFNPAHDLDGFSRKLEERGALIDKAQGLIDSGAQPTPESVQGLVAQQQHLETLLAQKLLDADRASVGRQETRHRLNSFSRTMSSHAGSRLDSRP